MKMLCKSGFVVRSETWFNWFLQIMFYCCGNSDFYGDNRPPLFGFLNLFFLTPIIMYMCIRVASLPIEILGRTGSCNRGTYTDWERSMCWTVGPRWTPLMWDQDSGSGCGPRGDPDDGGPMGIGSHLALHLRVSHSLDVNCKEFVFGHQAVAGPTGSFDHRSCPCI